MSSPWYYPDALLCLREKVRLSSRLLSIPRCAIQIYLRTMHATRYVHATSGFRTIEFPPDAGDPPTISFRARRDPIINLSRVPQFFNQFLTLDVIRKQLVGFPVLMSIPV